jgi:hypothetical protein
MHFGALGHRHRRNPQRATRDEGLKKCRTREILAGAACIVFNEKEREFTGHFLI